MKIKKTIYSCLFLFAVTAGSLFSLSANLEEISGTRIDFGLEKTQILNEKGGGEDWKPLFFDVDDAGYYHIPDFYKQRIAVFDRKGAFIKEKPCEAGISPRMNFFALTVQGNYITYNDGSLYHINKTGALSWKYNFGIGVIPERIFPADTALFIVLPGAVDDDHRAIIFDYFNAKPIGRFGIKKDGIGLPVIQGTSGIPFTLNLKDMPLVSKTKDSYKLDTDASLLYIAANGESIWKKALSSGETIICFSKEGALTHKGSIYYPGDSPGSGGTGFWTVADKDRIIYKNYFYDDYMEIVAYSFSGE